VISGVLKKWLTKFFESGRGEKKEKKKKTTKSRLESVLVSYESDEWKLRRREKQARKGKVPKSPRFEPKCATQAAGSLVTRNKEKCNREWDARERASIPAPSVSAALAEKKERGKLGGSGATKSKRRTRLW
jgi:hypothetical protein